MACPVAEPAGDTSTLPVATTKTPEKSAVPLKLAEPIAPTGGIAWKVRVRATPSRKGPQRTWVPSPERTPNSLMPPALQPAGSVSTTPKEVTSVSGVTLRLTGKETPPRYVAGRLLTSMPLGSMPRKSVAAPLATTVVLLN